MITVHSGKFQGDNVAVKRVRQIKHGDDYVKGQLFEANNEENVLKELNHENIIKLLYVKSNRDFRLLALELCNATLDQLFLPVDDLKRYKGQMPFPSTIMLQLAEGLKYLHSKKLVHREIQPKNAFVYTDPTGKKVTMKWAGFKLCERVNDQGTFTVNEQRMGDSARPIKVNEIWLAPEWLNKLDAAAEAQTPLVLEGTNKIDVFAQGLVFGYVLLNGKHPFGSKKKKKRKENLRNDKKVNVDECKCFSTNFL